MYRSIWGLVFLLLCATGMGAHAATWTVEEDGSGDFETIQEAVDAAGAGDLVLVGPGTYTDLHVDSHGTQSVLELKSGVVVESTHGFEETILDTSEGDEERRPVSGYDLDAAAALVGFTLQFGDAATGAGIYLFNSNARIASNRVFDNYAGAGGGIVCEGPTAPLIEENEIIDNTACCGEGGGILVNGGSSARIVRNVLRGNSGFGGGGIALSQAGEPEVVENRVIGNIGLAGGGIASISSGGRIEGNQVLENEAQQGGGMIAWSGGSAIFSGNVVARNVAAGDGGGYHISADTPRLVNETIVANRSFLGAGVFLWNNSEAMIENCIVAFGIDGEGIYAEDPSSVPQVQCTDVYGNSFGEYGGFVEDQTGLNGNLSVDPIFCGWEDGDYHLAAESPLRLRVSQSGGGCPMRGALLDKCLSTGPEAYVALSRQATPFPNPTRGAVVIPRMASEQGVESLDIVDVGGRRVHTLNAGLSKDSFEWDGRDATGRRMPSGVYFAIRPDGTVQSRILLTQ